MRHDCGDRRWDRAMMAAGRPAPSHGGNAALDPEPAIPAPGSAAFATDYVRANRPAALAGLVKDWPAVRCWTPTYLADLTAMLGDIQVPYRSMPERMKRMDLARIRQGQMSLTALLEACADDPGGEELYVPGMALPEGVGPGRDIEKPSLLQPFETFGTTIFLGRNTKCIGHFHPKAHALLCQVQGTKKVWMFPPSELGRLHLFPAWSQGFFQSEVNFYGNLAPFPNLARAKGQMYELHPGDALFIPMHWLHVPEGAGWTAAVTYWWRPALSEWLRSAGSLRALVGVGGQLVRRGLGRTG